MRAAAMNRRALHLYAELGRTPRVVECRDWGNLARKYPGEPLLPKRWPVECGTTTGHRAHLRAGETPCHGCADAHRIAVMRPAKQNQETAA